MAWTNGPREVYHGTDLTSGAAILPVGGPHAISLAPAGAFSDFGPGFYTTTNLQQARQWANQRVRRLGGAAVACVATFQLDRTALGSLQHLAFVTDDSDFYDLVAFGRRGGVNHARAGGPYDVVYGPVALWPQTLAIKDCDQISFHTLAAVAMLQGMGLKRPPAGAHF
jgi:hypothetical protein